MGLTVSVVVMGRCPSNWPAGSRRRPALAGVGARLAGASRCRSTDPVYNPRVSTHLSALMVRALDTRRAAYFFLRRFWWSDRRTSVAKLMLSTNDFNFVIMTMIRHSDRYLSDWVLFHHMAGAQHFFIYVNEPDYAAIARIRDTLEPEGLSHLVTFLHWPEPTRLVRQGSSPRGSRRLPTTHEAACMHFKKTFGKKTNYYMKLDSDEYIFRTDFDEHGLGIGPLLRFSGNLLIRGYNFGSSGEATYSPIPDPCRFTLRQEAREWRKSISHSATTREIFNTHVAQQLQGVHEPDELPIQINHYRIRSFQEFQDNKLAAGGTIATDYQVTDFGVMDAEYNSVSDDAACRAFNIASSSWKDRSRPDEPSA